MQSNLAKAATLAGYVGLLVLIVSVAGRFYGEKPFLGIKAMNVYLVGVGVIVWAIWARLESRNQS